MSAVRPPVPAERRSPERVGVAHVLLVDDSRTTRTILRGMLERTGFRVTEAANGEEALARCEAELPDLVLLDLDMPVMDGQTCLTRIRGTKGMAAVPVVVLTANASATAAASAFELGAQDYVRKTCTDDELRARMTAVLQRHQRERELRERIAYVNSISAVDELTRLGNRRALERYTERMAAAGRDHRPVGIVVLDIDHFKRVNDTDGHLVGDAVLRALSRRLESALDPNCLLMRWGGEEFVVVAPGLDDAATQALGEHLHAVVGSSPCAIGGRRAITITVSVGCTCGPLREFERLVRAADAALYEAKRTGRDRVLHRPAGGA